MALLLAACDKDTIEATHPDDIATVAVGEQQGSPQTGWTVGGLDDTAYDLEFYTKSISAATQPYLTAAGRATAIVPSPRAWAKHIVRGVRPEGGQLHIALSGDVEAIDHLLLTTAQAPDYRLIKGADISELTYVEQHGGKYRRADGTEGDCLDILRENGVNLVRLRLYNDPGNAAYQPSARLPQGIQDEADILNLAKRAKAAGMMIQLTFHYSDFWTNGQTQDKPHAWADLHGEALQQAVHDFTAQFLDKMAAQGTTPEFVSLGNEVQAGMLYPDGACADFATLAALLNAGARAVREKAPEARIIIHTANGGDLDNGKWLFGGLRDRGVDYDIIGASYYPFWTGKTANEAGVWAGKMSELFGKDVIFMETGYAWQRTLPDGTVGQLQHNGPYDEYSREGQRDFIANLSNQCKLVPGGRALGYIYWDPIFIETPQPTGWVLGEKNFVSNTTLFDFDGKELPVVQAIKHND